MFFDDSDRPLKKLRIHPPAQPPAPKPELTDYELDLLRHEAQDRLRTTWEDIIERYSRPGIVADEIDLETGEVVVDNGHLRGMERLEFGDVEGDEERESDFSEGEVHGEEEEEVFEELLTPGRRTPGSKLMHLLRTQRSGSLTPRRNRTPHTPSRSRQDSAPPRFPSGLVRQGHDSGKGESIISTHASSPGAESELSQESAHDWLNAGARTVKGAGEDELIRDDESEHAWINAEDEEGGPVGRLTLASPSKWLNVHAANTPVLFRPSAIPTPLPMSIFMPTQEAAAVLTPAQVEAVEEGMGDDLWGPSRNDPFVEKGKRWRDHHPDGSPPPEMFEREKVTLMPTAEGLFEDYDQGYWEDGQHDKKPVDTEEPMDEGSNEWKEHKAFENASPNPLGLLLHMYRKQRSVTPTDVVKTISPAPAPVLAPVTPSERKTTPVKAITSPMKTTVTPSTRMTPKKSLVTPATKITPKKAMSEEPKRRLWTPIKTVRKTPKSAARPALRAEDSFASVASAVDVDGKTASLLEVVASEVRKGKKSDAEDKTVSVPTSECVTEAKAGEPEGTAVCGEVGYKCDKAFCFKCIGF
ncbi:hypothetical protein SAICODRAFT_162121 [Saitoella complicata NRRL Y-17804]|uniref:uncharacterized protein n=1 Tax=Saitoella complicata (strain BCRC 22490 / CBS 7301 / JCM 7358 / NBRC 10748 / NRRL Y-17804) TaxID=698492 RepID=UPI000866B76A|nr:uncharacterized protein SAICODRAFT_162121 [Saitoella complicata NRRL Y-17804]ODQ51051.1 hypothetical protein SAICODRAFT_162121 [Saitoella complicata NRRL Y-17804]